MVCAYSILRDGRVVHPQQVQPSLVDCIPTLHNLALCTLQHARTGLPSWLLIYAACIVHLTPHSIHHATWAIYAHACTVGCAIHALRTCICTPCPPQSAFAPLMPMPLAPSTFAPTPFAPAASTPFALSTSACALSASAAPGLEPLQVPAALLDAMLPDMALPDAPAVGVTVAVGTPQSWVDANVWQLLEAGMDGVYGGVQMGLEPSGREQWCRCWGGGHVITAADFKCTMDIGVLHTKYKISLFL